MESGKPLIFGKTVTKELNWMDSPVFVNLGEGVSANDCWIHDERSCESRNSFPLLRQSEKNPNHLPRPFGVFYVEDRGCYEEKLQQQLTEAKE